MSHAVRVPVRYREISNAVPSLFVERVAKDLAGMSSPVVLERHVGDLFWIDVANDDVDALPEITSRGASTIVTTFSVSVAEATAERHPDLRALCLYGASTSKHPGVVYLGGLVRAPSLESPVENDAAARFAKLLGRLATVPDFRPVTPVGRPMKAMVEVIRACNLRCPLCPVGNGQAEHYANMSPKLFQKIVSALAPTVSLISLYNYGEPLLHPEIATLVRIAHHAGIERVDITSNGTILPQGVEDALVAAGLDSIRISVDGATQNSYAQYRVGGDLARIWVHIDRIRNARERVGSQTPFIEAQFVVNRHNEHEMEQFRGLCREHGVDRVRFKTFNALMTGTSLAGAGREFLPTDSRLSRYTDQETLTIRDHYKLSTCSWPWQRIVVNADGAIVPCCYDFNGRHRLGLFSQGAETEWWETAARRDFRERLRANPLDIDICSICPIGIPSLDVHFD